MNKKGFTLIEIIVVLVLLTIIGTITIINLTNNSDKTIEKSIAKTITSADIYLSVNQEIKKTLETLKYEDSYGYKIISLNELYDNGLIDDKIYDSLKNYKDEENNSYDSMAAFLNSDGLIEIKYPYNDDFYLKIDKNITLSQNEPFNCNYVLEQVIKHKLENNISPENISSFEDISLKCYTDSNMTNDITNTYVNLNNRETKIYYTYINNNNVKMLTYINVKFDNFISPEVATTDVSNTNNYKTKILNNEKFIYNNSHTYYISKNENCSNNYECKNLLKFNNVNNYYIELKNYEKLEDDDNFIKYSLIYDVKQPTNYFDLNVYEGTYIGCDELGDDTYCYNKEFEYEVNVPKEKVFEYYINENQENNNILNKVDRFIEQYKIENINSSVSYNYNSVHNEIKEAYYKGRLYNTEGLFSHQFLGMYDDILLFYYEEDDDTPKLYYVNYRTGDYEIIYIKNSPEQFSIKKSKSGNMIIIKGISDWRNNDAYLGDCTSSVRYSEYTYCGYNYDNGRLIKNKCNYHFIKDLTTNSRACNKLDEDKYYINDILSSKYNFESENELYFKYNNGFVFDERFPDNMTDEEKQIPIGIINDTSNNIYMTYRRNGTSKYEAIDENNIYSKFTKDDIDYYIIHHRRIYYVLKVYKEENPGIINLNQETENKKIINIILDNEAEILNSNNKTIYNSDTTNGDNLILSHLNELIEIIN